MAAGRLLKRLLKQEHENETTVCEELFHIEKALHTYHGLSHLTCLFLYDRAPYGDLTATKASAGPRLEHPHS